MPATPTELTIAERPDDTLGRDAATGHRLGRDEATAALGRDEATAAAPTGVSGARRDRGLDSLRGAAILLMIIDHVLVVAMATTGSADWMIAIRSTLTRLSMPLFMIVSGLLLARRGAPSLKRVTQILLAAGYLNLLFLLVDVGFAVPEILAVWLLLLPFYRLITRHPVEAAGLGILQAWYVPIPWAGYQPGAVAAFLALGALLASRSDSVLLRGATSLPEWCEAVGRRPLLWYVGHLTLLVGVGAIVLYL